MEIDMQSTASPRAFLYCLHAAVFFHYEVETRLEDGLFHLLKGNAVGVVVYECRAGGKVHIGRVHAIQLTQVAFHVGGASGTSHSHDGYSFCFHDTLCVIMGSD